MLWNGIQDESNIYRSDPVSNYNFALTVEAIYDIPLKSVRPIVKNNNYERIREGGINDYVHLKRMPITEPFTIQVERYASNSILDPLANGAELTLPVILKVAKSTGAYHDNNTARIYVFTGCTVMGKEYGELNAERSGLCTEIITIAYREMVIIPNVTNLGGDEDDFGSKVVTKEYNPYIPKKDERKVHDVFKSESKYTPQNDEETVHTFYKNSKVYKGKKYVGKAQTPGTVQEAFKNETEVEETEKDSRTVQEAFKTEKQYVPQKNEGNVQTYYENSKVYNSKKYVGKGQTPGTVQEAFKNETEVEETVKDNQTVQEAFKSKKNYKPKKNEGNVQSYYGNSKVYKGKKYVGKAQTPGTVQEAFKNETEVEETEKDNRTVQEAFKSEKQYVPQGDKGSVQTFYENSKIYNSKKYTGKEQTPSSVKEAFASSGGYYIPKEDKRTIWEVYAPL